MSRSNPHENTPNPAVRWFEWNGEAGSIRYYDKDAKQNVDIGGKFRFLLLDQLGSVGGFHEASNSGIFSNEVRDTNRDTLIVKARKAGILAEGRYKDIKDRVNTAGGQFVANCYIAFKHGEGLALGSFRFKGAALGAWFDFCKANRAALYKKAIAIDGFTEGKKGRVVFRVPQFAAVELSGESNDAAVALDAELQDWLKAYFARNMREQVEHAPKHEPQPENGHEPVPPLTDDDIPFAWLLPMAVPMTGAFAALTALV